MTPLLVILRSKATKNLTRMRAHIRVRFLAALGMTIGGMLLFALPAAAQVSADVPGLALAGTDPRIIAARIIRVALGFLGVVVLALIIYGGFLWMTAAGNEERMEKAKKVLTNSIIGLVIVLSAFAITQFILSKLTQATRGPTVVTAGGGGPGGAGLPPDAFIVKGISPKGAIPIRNVVVRVVLNRAPNSSTLAGNVVVARKEDGAVVDGALTVSGTTVEFRPASPCPSPNQTRKCFDADTDFQVEVKTGLRSTTGKTVLCGGLAPSCTGEFRTGNLVDTEPPTVTIESPDHGASVPVDTCVPVQARVVDDAGVSAVEFYADGRLIEDGTVVPVTTTLVDNKIVALVEISCWPTSPPAPSRHKLKAKAFDIDDNNATSSEVEVVVRPLHCFNSVKDDDEDEVDCDSAVGGPSGCGLCNGATCTASRDCASGACLDGKCASPTTITGVSPGDGRAGTFVTFAGLSFGGTPGRVVFKDDKLASAPAACAGATTWSDNYALVGLPEGAVTGPVVLERAGCAVGDLLCRDATDDTRGPIVPVHTARPPLSPPSEGGDEVGVAPGSFWVNDTAHPGLCSLNPTQGLWNTRIDLRGAQFGTQPGSVFFGVIAGAVANWSDSGAQTAVPPISYGPVPVQITNLDGVPSNALPFEVLSPDAGTLPELVSVTPPAGGIGTGITLSGRNFGAQPGSVYFIAADGTARLADVSLPAQCGSTWWTPNTITVKVPSGLIVDTTDELYVHRYDGQQSNRKEFAVNSTPAGPFLACIRPLAGPRFTNVSVYGERLGGSAEPPRGLYFTAQSSASILAFNLDGSVNNSWAGVRANLSSQGGVPKDACPPSGWSATEVCAQAPDGSRTGAVLAEQDLPGPETRRSNPLSFTIGSCLAPEGDPLHLTCTPGTICCGDGSCNTVCPTTTQPQGAYGWQFTTVPAPLVPEVLSRCDKAIKQDGTFEAGHPEFPPSPAPADRQGVTPHGNVCVNAQVAITLTTPVRPETLNANTIKIEKCTGSQDLLTGPNSTFGGDTSVWARPPAPALASPPPSHESHLQVERVQNPTGCGPDECSKLGDNSGFSLRLTKLDDDTGPGWPNELGIQQNYEHWFGYQGNLNLDTNGKTYTVSAWMRAPDDAGVGKRAGMVIQRDGSTITLPESATAAERASLWQKAVYEDTLTKNWKQFPVSITFDAGPGRNAPGFIRVFLEGTPHDIRIPEGPTDPTQIFSVLVDDVQVVGDPCTTTAGNMVSNGAIAAYPGNIGFNWYPTLSNFEPSAWYRVTLLGGTGGIAAQDVGVRQGQPMKVIEQAQTQCGYDNAAHCFRFKTKNEPNPDDNLCAVGGIAVTPSPWTAKAENETIDYAAMAVAAGDPCVAVRPDSYAWSWASANPAKAVVSYNASATPPHVGYTCTENADCAIGAQGCVGGFCTGMPWTTTAVALQETNELPGYVGINATAQEVTGTGKLFIEFEPPRVVSYWPSCGEACLNAEIGAQFSKAMLNSNTDPAGITNAANIALWAIPCGNGAVEAGEDCDDGNTLSGDGCSNVCLKEGSNFNLRCGDGNQDPGEDCDDGNLTANDGCSPTCLNEGAPTTCGNGAVDLHEDCDDSNKTSGDGCSSSCLNEGTRSDVPICGNQRLDRGEECEARVDGTFESWCNPVNCLRRGPTQALACGNGRLDPGEECDPNSSLLDTATKKALCNGTCQWTGTQRPPAAGGQGCGNGRIEIGEDCDDDNLRPNDGCDEFCRNEGSAAGTTPACGNSQVDPGEDCDDGNVNAGDGCSDQCLHEGRPGAACGNGQLETGEECDSQILGQTYTAAVVSAICSADCRNLGADPVNPAEGANTAKPNTCGNNTRNDGEDCDDGGNTSGDGCSASCLNEGRSPERVQSPILSWDSQRQSLRVEPAVLSPNTFYRALVSGEISSCRGEGCTQPGKQLTELNYHYNWTAAQAPLPEVQCTNALSADPARRCNTFSWTFKTKDVVCGIDRVELLPLESSLYVIGARESYSAQPYGPPDSCDPAGQRLSAISYNWGFASADPAVASIVGAPGMNVIPSCGNGRLERGEDCDDGNTQIGDGCSAACLNEGSGFLIACGNFSINPGEECDDGQAVSGDGCGAACLKEGTSAAHDCGNGALDLAEDCDDGNTLPGDGCSPRCLNEGSSRLTGECGNGVIDHPEGDPQNGGEECDPADNTTHFAGEPAAPLLRHFCNPDTCLLTGSLPAAKCNNGTVEKGEECEDGNLESGDGCSAICLREGRSAVPAGPCGNGKVDKHEDCDDGNTAAGDGCSGRCLHEGTAPERGPTPPATLPEAPPRIDPLQLVEAEGIKKFCRAATGLFPSESQRRACQVNSECTDLGEGWICAAPNPWSTVAIVAAAQEKSGNAALTVFCGANTDKDCPIPRGLAGNSAIGRGADSCCYRRPQIVDRTPEVGSLEVCRNALLQARFSQELDSQSFAGNFLIARRHEGMACPAGTRPLRPDGTIGEPVAAPAPPGPATFFERLWQKILGVLRWIVPDALAQDEVWCIDPALTLTADQTVAVEDDERLGIVTLQPSTLLGSADSAVRYRLVLQGDRNINDGEAQGLRSFAGVSFYGQNGGADTSWEFETGRDVCTLDRVGVEGGTNFSATGQTAQAAATAYHEGKTGSQPIYPVPGYRWSWSWGTSDEPVAAVTNTDQATQTVTAGNRNGTAQVNATAKITENTAQPATPVDTTRVGMATFTTFLCENPWPATGPLEDRELAPLCPLGASGCGATNFSTRFCRDAGETGVEDDLPLLKHPPVVLFARLNFAKQNLGGFAQGPAAYAIAAHDPNNPSAPHVIKEFLLTTADGKEAVGIRVMSNPERLPLSIWYNRVGLGGQPTPYATPIDGYEALQDGQTIYVAAINANLDPEYLGTRKAFSNVYVFSLSQGAPASVKNIFDQLITNLRFNINLQNLKVCQGLLNEDGSQKPCSKDLDCGVGETTPCLADKEKLTRDLLRMNHLSIMQNALASYKGRTQRYPTLEAGTFIRSISSSLWPSWQDTLGAALGAPMPKDPINLPGAPCVAGPGESGTYNPATCYNELAQRYRCPKGSHIYQYQSIGGESYKLSAEFELLERPEQNPLAWDVPGWIPASSAQATVETGGICQWQPETGGSEWSNASAVCGNRVLETRPDGTLEECEAGTSGSALVSLGATGQLRCSGDPAVTCAVEGEACTPGLNDAPRGACKRLTSCTAQRTCSNSCTWNPWRSGTLPTAASVVADCAPGGTFCGNGVRDDYNGDGELDEPCDDGLLNGQYGKCNTACTGLHADYCGDGEITHHEVCDDGGNNGGSYNTGDPDRGWCRFDCSGFGDRCGDTQVNGPEQCEGAGLQKFAQRCYQGAPDKLNTACTAHTDCGQTATGAPGICAYCNPQDPTSFSLTPRTNPPTGGYLYTWTRSCTGCNWSPWSCVVQSGCGDGVKEGLEECDDPGDSDAVEDANGNNIPDGDEDGCLNNCKRATCGDTPMAINQGLICTSGVPDKLGDPCSEDSGCGQGGKCQDGEECDSGSLNGTPCPAPYGSTCTYCNPQCRRATASGGFCGDTLYQSAHEQCEGSLGLADDIGTLQWVCKGAVGAGDWFWGFGQESELQDWIPNTDVTFTRVAGAGYGSNTALQITSTVSADRRPWVKPAGSLASASSYTASMQVNTADADDYGKTVKLTLKAFGPSDFAGKGSVVLDDNPNTWQYVKVDGSFAYNASAPPIELGIELVGQTYDAVRIDNVSLRPANPTCLNTNCTVQCSSGARCQNYIQRCNGGSAGGAPCATDAQCPNGVCAPYDSDLDLIANDCDNDNDRDGYPPPADCLDSDTRANPDRIDVCNDGINNDCVGGIDDQTRDITVRVWDSGYSSDDTFEVRVNGELWGTTGKGQAVEIAQTMEVHCNDVLTLAITYRRNDDGTLDNCGTLGFEVTGATVSYGAPAYSDPGTGPASLPGSGCISDPTTDDIDPDTGDAFDPVTVTIPVTVSW